MDNNISQVLNVTVNETAKNATGREAATPQGLFVAYSSLIVMAVLPIFFGSFRSVIHYRRQKVLYKQLDFLSNYYCRYFE